MLVCAAVFGVCVVMYGWNCVYVLVCFFEVSVDHLDLHSVDSRQRQMCIIVRCWN
mgnify:CR=1 FL=1